jgi:uncharacterized protein YggT (Ycf19 family)
MEIIITLLSNTVFLLLCLLEGAIWVRVILGCFFAADDSALYRVFMFVTQPFLLPVRVLLDKMRIGGGLLDLSAVVCCAVIIPVMAVLPGVTV